MADFGVGFAESVGGGVVLVILGAFVIRGLDRGVFL